MKRPHRFLNLQTNMFRFGFKSLVLLSIVVVLLMSPMEGFIDKPLEMRPVIKPADVIVVFSSGVASDCRPDRYTAEREAYGLDLLREGYSRSGKIIFSGGRSTETGLNIATCMAKNAISEGIGLKSIVEEPQASNTHENALFTKALMDKNHWTTALLVTSSFHMRRSYWCMKTENIPSLPAPVPNPPDHAWLAWHRLKNFELDLHEYIALFAYRCYGFIKS